MSYKLFLDDIRDPSWVYPTDPGPWQICRTMAEAVAAVNARGWPSYVSFDHDLGEDTPSGMDFAKWLIDLDLSDGSMPDTFRYHVHSANPVGERNIRMLLANYLNFKGVG